MSCNLLFAQVTNITGTIKDDKGRTLPGITVSERGTKNQASSGGDGNFTIKVKGIPTALIISGVGYKKQ